MVARGDYFDPAPHPVVAVSDGGGEVVEIGPAVTRQAITAAQGSVAVVIEIG